MDAEISDEKCEVNRGCSSSSRLKFSRASSPRLAISISALSGVVYHRKRVVPNSGNPARSKVSRAIKYIKIELFHHSIH